MPLMEFKGIKEGERHFFDPKAVTFESFDDFIIVLDKGSTREMLVHPSELFRILDAVHKKEI